MKKSILLLLAIIVLPAAAFAQAPKAADKPVAPATEAKKEEPKDKPLIIERAKILEAENLALKLSNVRLQAEAAIPDDLKKAIKDAEKALSDFYKDKIGVTREELTGYDIANGVDGAIILTKKKPAAPPAPAKP